MTEQFCKYSPLYSDADESFTVNFGNKRLKTIRISLPKPPPLHLIDGFGLHPDDQVFKRLEVPIKLTQLQKRIYNKFADDRVGVNGTNILRAFWDEIELHREEYADEITWLKRFIYFYNYGYWQFIDGKPTFFPPWYFSYLNTHRMTTDAGYRYPEYREKGLRRFLFRHYLLHATETFADINPETGVAFKVPDENGKLHYRMIDTGKRLFFGPIEPKDRRGGLTNESVHIILRIMMSERGADKLGTIVSMGSDNAETHFTKKLVPAWNSLPLWLRPIWKGGLTIAKQLVFSANGSTDVDTLDCAINFTESGEDLANDGKMVIAALYDEQGKGKKTGNVQTRWQINKETMSLSGGSKIIGFCTHPSTVEKMSEGGADYKEMCDMSDFYQRKKDGQTVSGLSVCYMPSSYCLEDFIDKWGKPIEEYPTPRQIQAGFNGKIGSRIFIKNKRRDLYKEDDPVKMEEYRSFVRKYPEDYDECWTGVAGQLGLDNEKIRNRLLELENKPRSKRGEFVWADKRRLIVRFEERANGKWVICYEMPAGEANRVSSMEDYSAIEDDDIVVNRPANPRFIVGVDPQQFSNKSESMQLKGTKTKKSDTGMVVLRRRDKSIDVSEDKSTWKTRKIVAFMRERLGSNYDAADEALKVAVYYGGLIHIEINRTDVWERLVEQRMGGYLNYCVDISADGQMKRAPKPGTSLGGDNKKKGFGLLDNYITFHVHNEDISEPLKEADEISSLEQLGGYDGLSAWIEALFGDESPYADLMNRDFGDSDSEVETLGAQHYRY